MDVNQPPQTPQEKKFNGFLFFEVGLIEVFSVIFALLVIFGALNYFNILPVSDSLPFFSFLPKQKIISENKTQAKPVLSQEEINRRLRTTLPFLGCPVEKDLCAKGIAINEPRSKIASFSAVAFADLAQDEPILAAIDGDIKFSGGESTQASTLITIENQGRNIIATYELPKGSFKVATSSASVKQGDEIGSLTDNKPAIAEFGKKLNLILYAQVISSKTYILLSIKYS